MARGRLQIDTMKKPPTPKALRSAREAAGLLQSELATKCGVTATTVSRWETGAAIPSVKSTRKIAKALPALKGET